MATNNMHNLTTLIKRLEAATARLEDIASSTIELPQAVPNLQQGIVSPTSGSSSVSTPGAPSTSASTTTTTKAPAAPAAPAEPLPESIEEFDAFLNDSVAKFVAQSNKRGGLVAEQAAKVQEGFRAQRTFLLITTRAKKPDMTGSEMSVYQNLLKPINEALMAVSNIKDANRGSPDFNHLSTVSEGIMVLAWVTVENRPYKHVDDSLGSAQFFGNRVLKEYKDKDPQQVEWVQAFYQMFRDLADYVKQYFANGVPWNPNGKPAQEVAKEVAASSSTAAPPPPPPPSSAGGAPPPPPPPPPPGPPPVLQIKEEGSPAASAQTSSAHGAVFSEINKGEEVTKGLRKVDKSQMTHKNPALRAGSTVAGATTNASSGPRGKSPVPGKKPKPENMRVKKPPRKVLEGNKWTIENYDKEAVAALGGPIEIEASINQSILISKCANTTVIVRGKGNAVTVENTSRLSLVVETLVSAVDVVKSQNFALQVLGTIPTLMLDQVDNAQVYLSKASTSTKVFMSKTEGVNLNVLTHPDGGGDDNDEESGDYKEVALPSQICSYFDTTKGELVSEIVSHAG
ncbi:adenylyl cyclase-associated protein [Niveomyces insectorum RCEF 264]|uniref:Adenylyl cyclase-associated protein n=1 Tax=Niveomyces insectorum RCEF 264 TaxID=1081102 RepID=A0A168ABS4_9HYPO|nr:adenylyl cyclase-associated protein [Niveomyces insectorum RCEF 264]